PVKLCRACSGHRGRRICQSRHGRPRWVPFQSLRQAPAELLLLGCHLWCLPGLVQHGSYWPVLLCSSMVVSNGAPENGVFHFRDSFGDLNAARACLGAVEHGATAPHTLFVIEDLQTHVAGVIARIENETMRIDDGRRSEILPIGPEHGTC